MNKKRGMVYKFVQLPDVVQKAIVTELGLIEDRAELGLSPVSLWQTLAFVRASKRDQLAELESAIEKAFAETRR